jgi:hypothetical protein
MQRKSSMWQACCWLRLGLYNAWCIAWFAKRVAGRLVLGVYNGWGIALLAQPGCFTRRTLAFPHPFLRRRLYGDAHAETKLSLDNTMKPSTCKTQPIIFHHSPVAPRLILPSFSGMHSKDEHSSDSALLNGCWDNASYAANNYASENV